VQDLEGRSRESPIAKQENCHNGRENTSKWCGQESGCIDTTGKLGKKREIMNLGKKSKRFFIAGPKYRQKKQGHERERKICTAVAQSFRDRKDEVGGSGRGSLELSGEKRRKRKEKQSTNSVQGKKRRGGT